MPSETEQLKVKISLADGKIKILTDDYKALQNHIINDQKSNSPKDQNSFMFCMLGDKLLHIQINNVSHQKDSTNQFVVESVSTTNGDAGWKEEKGVEEIKKTVWFPRGRRGKRNRNI